MDNELAWAAGFFDGEGSIGVIRRDGTLHVQIGQNDPRPLDRFARAVGTGQVRGPYGPYLPGRKPQWKFTAYGVEAAAVMDRLMPYLSGPKQEQYRRALDDKEALVAVAA